MTDNQSISANPDQQFGFDVLLRECDAENRMRTLERQTAHLPGDMDEAKAFYRQLIFRHHEAMMAADEKSVFAIREEAHLLARKLDNDGPGILAHDDAPGYVLARSTAVEPGTVPLWGQEGSFEIHIKAVPIHITLHGLFGIGSTVMYWPGFEARAVRRDRPFITSTGYRSFLGIHAERKQGITPDVFVSHIINSFLTEECRGRLVPISKQFQ